MTNLSAERTAAPDFFDEVLRRHFGPAVGPAPRISREDFGDLLTDDAEYLLAQTRLAALDWARTEKIKDIEIVAERALFTQHGLLYAVALRPRRPGATGLALYYLAPPPFSFEPIVGQIESTVWPPGKSVAAVDGRLGHELAFTRLLTTPLRRLLDAHQVLRLDLAGPAGRWPAA